MQVLTHTYSINLSLNRSHRRSLPNTATINLEAKLGHPHKSFLEIFQATFAWNREWLSHFYIHNPVSLIGV